MGLFKKHDETDMLILTLSGFRKEHIPELLVLTQAEAGKVRAALRRKLPFGLYWRSSWWTMHGTECG